MKIEDMIKDADAEITALKTAHIKSAGSVRTTSVGVSVGIPLQLFGSMVRGSKTARITATTDDPRTVFLASCTINDLDSLDGRSVEIKRLAGENGAVAFLVAVTAGNANDKTKLSGGDSVTAWLTLDVVATAPISVVGEVGP